MSKYFDIKFTITITILAGLILLFWGAYTGKYEVMYTGAGIVTARTGFNMYRNRYEIDR